MSITDWVLVNTGREEDVLRIADSVKKIGRQVTILSLKEAYNEDYASTHPNKREITLYGPVGPVKYLTETDRWLSWLDLPAIRCRKYYSHFGGLLVNNEYAMMPLADVRRTFDYWCRHWPNPDGLFVRPDENDKSFKAQIMDRKDVSDLLRAIPEETLCVVAPVRDIAREWRCFMHRGKFLTGSLYKEEGEIKKDINVPANVIAFANQAAYRRYEQLPPVWVIDVAEVRATDGAEVYPGGLAVLEVSGSCCAGFYEADHDLIIETITKEADLFFSPSKEGK